MRWVFLSPHLDDVVLSCGGLVWEYVQAGQPVEIWTVCAGAPLPGQPISAFAQSLHERWETGQEAVDARRAEDQAAAGRLNAHLRYWDLPDCIYRALPDGSWLVNGEDDLWKTVNPQEEGVVERLSNWLVGGLAPDSTMISPLTLGNHVDHFLVRAAAERAARRAGCPLFYYPDYPYAVGERGNLAGKVGEGWQQVCQPVSREALHAWQEAVACYASQISTFWSGLADMEQSLEIYWQSGGGTCLWHPA